MKNLIITQNSIYIDFKNNSYKYVNQAAIALLQSFSSYDILDEKYQLKQIHNIVFEIEKFTVEMEQFLISLSSLNTLPPASLLEELDDPEFGSIQGLFYFAKERLCLALLCTFLLNYGSIYIKQYIKKHNFPALDEVLINKLGVIARFFSKDPKFKDLPDQLEKLPYITSIERITTFSELTVKKIYDTLSIYKQCLSYDGLRVLNIAEHISLHKLLV